MATYKHAVPLDWNGLTFRVAPSYKTSDNRWRMKTYLLGLDGKPLSSPKILSSPVGGSAEDLECSLPDSLAEIAHSHADQLVDQALSSPDLTLKLKSYVALREKEIQLYCKWGEKADKYWEEWARICPAFGDMSITQCNDEQAFTDRMETITHRQSRKTGYSERERILWVILGGILWYAVEVDNLLEVNPLKKLSKECKEKLSTIASKDLARQSLTHAELSGLLTDCQRESDRSDVHAAMMLQIFTGVTIPELCGLNCGDWKHGNQVSWLEITRAYNQVRYKNPVLTNRLSSGNAYRRIPCTKAVETLLSRQIHRHGKKTSGNASNPLFLGYHGDRLTPQEYKVALRQMLDPLIQEGAVLYFTERNSFLSGENRPTIFHGDLLRSTAEYYYRTVCKMNVSEIAAVLGVDREHTFAISYVDWGNEQVLLYLQKKINRWHTFQSSYSEGHLRRGLTVSGTAAPGAVLQISSAHGAEGIIESIMKGA